MHQPGLISAQSCQNGPTYLAAPPGAPLSHGSSAFWKSNGQFTDEQAEPLDTVQ